MRRIQKLNKISSLFLFGARGCGKSTLLREHFSGKKTLWIDLLSADAEDRFRREPDQLSFLIAQQKPEKVVLDEIQKIPKLLDVVHREIEKKPQLQFILTGSSARKLKAGGANLLAGRAIDFFLFPLTTQEFGKKFNLEDVLRFGSLPKLLHLKSEAQKIDYLKAYARTYLKEEILQEQIIRNVEPFQDFLEVAAQSNGKILNYNKIALDLGVSDKTVKNYFSILIDTYIGFILHPFHRSVRKRQREAPKFYFFDNGVKCAIDRTIGMPIKPKTYHYGDAFESWIVQECFRLNEYYKKDFRFSYLRTQADVEVDIVVDHPAHKEVLIEIKSSSFIRETDVRSLSQIASDWDQDCEAQLWSQDPHPKVINGVQCLYWKQALKKLFGVKLNDND